MLQFLSIFTFSFLQAKWIAPPSPFCSNLIDADVEGYITVALLYLKILPEITIEAASLIFIAPPN